MRALLDVKVLIALLDGSHIHHGLVTDWLRRNLRKGWASCPVTQNGCIRILSQPGYPNSVPAAQVAERLTEATQHPSHVFWADSISLLHPGRLKWDQVLGSRQVIDAYLLALAIDQGGRHPGSRHFPWRCWRGIAEASRGSRVIYCYRAGGVGALAIKIGRSRAQ